MYIYGYAYKINQTIITGEKKVKDSNRKEKTTKNINKELNEITNSLNQVISITKDLNSNNSSPPLQPIKFRI